MNVRSDSIAEALKYRLLLWAEKVIRPPNSMVDPSARQQSQLLLGVLVCLIISGTLALLMQAISYRESLSEGAFWLTVLLWPFSFILYAFAKRGYTRQIAMASIFALLLFTTFRFTMDHAHSLPFYIILPLLLTALFFSFRATILIALLAMLLPAAILYISPTTQANDWEWLMESVLFFLPIGGIIQIYIHNQRTALKSAQDYLSVSEAMLEQRVEARTRQLQDSERSLREAQHNYYALFEQAHDAVFLLDFGGRHIQVNRRAADMLGYTPEEMQQLSVRETSAEIGKSTAVIERLLAGEHIPAYERIFRHKDGHAIPVEINLELVRNSEGRPQHIQSVVRDISERKKIERQVRLQSAALEAAANGIMITDRHGAIEWINAAYTQLAGYTLEEARGKNPRELVKSGKHDDAFYRALWETILAGKTWWGYIINRRKDGSLYTEEQTINPVWDEHGKISHFVAIKQDITDRERSADALQESEARYRSMFENNQAVKLLIDPESGSILDANSAATEFYGYPLDKLLSMRIQEINILTPDEIKAEMAQARLQQRHVFHFQHRLANGNIRDVEVYSGPVQLKQKQLLYSIVLDVTARTKTESALRESESRYRLLAENVSDVIIKSSPEGIRTFVAPACYGLMGYTPEEMLQRNTFDDIHPDDVTRTREAITEATQTDTTLFSLSHRLRHKAGHYIWCDVNCTIVRDEHSAVPVEIIAILHNITESKRAEDALRESEARYQSVVQTQTELICRYTPDLILTFVNIAYCRYFDKKPEDLIGRSFLDLIPEDSRAAVKAFYEELVRNKGTSSYEHEATMPDGTQRWQMWTDMTIVDSNGVVTAIQAVGVDITDRKRAENALRENEARLNNILDSMQEAVWSVELPDFKPLYFNVAVERVFGRPRSVFYDNEGLWGRMVHPEDAALFQQMINETRRTGRSIRELRILHADNSVRWVYSQMWLVRNQDGQAVRLEGIASDITTRKQVEMVQQSFLDDMRALQRIHLELSRIDDLDTLYEQMVLLPCEWLGLERVGLFALNENGAILSGTYGVDPNGEVRDEHYYQETVTPDHWSLDVLHAPDHVRFWSDAPLNDNGVSVGTGWKAGTALWNGQKSLGYLVTDNFVKGRAPRPYETELISVLGSIFGHLLERKRSEAIQRENENRLKMILQGTQAGTWEWNVLTGENFYNERWAEMIGYTLEEVTPSSTRTWEKLCHPDDLRVSNERQQLHFEGKTPYYECELRMRHKDGHWVWVWNRGRVTEWREDGKPAKMSGIHLDITERKRAEDALRESEEKFRSFIESAPISSFITNDSGKIILANKEATLVFGYEREELIGMSFDELLPEIIRNIPADNPISMAMDSDEYRMDTLEVLARRKNGTQFPCEIQLSSINSQPTPLVISFALDITHRKAAEDALTQALEREKELGELKSRFVFSASHEFRTPLAAILSTADNLSAYREKMTGEQIETRLNKIKTQVQHMRNIMDDILQLARIQEGRVEFRPNVGDIAALCREIVDEFATQPGNQGRIIYTVTTPHTTFNYDERLVRQMVNNLISNALKYSGDSKPVELNLSRDDTRMILRFKDEGIGIPQDDMNHLFEPFHRAANVGTISGTGLGLNIVKKIVEMHAGTIVPQSTVGVGTTFTVQLPLV